MAETNKERLDRLVKLNQEGAASARAAGKEPDWAKPKGGASAPKVKKFAKGGAVSSRGYGKKK
jgi:hypothetical protein